MVRYGAGYATSLAVWQLRLLINPLIVLPWAGPAAVGYVGLATRLAELLGLIKTTSWRLALASFARFADQPRRAVSAVTEGMRLQVVGVGAPLAAFAVLGPIVMPLLFQERWADWAPVMEVYPYLALAVLCNAVFSLHTSVLYVLHRNFLVTAFHAAHVALLMAGAAYFVPRYGIIGVGYAELLAMPSYAVIHLLLKHVVAAPQYGVAVGWAAAAAMLLFIGDLGWLAVSGVAAAAAWPRTWRELAGYMRMLRPLLPGATHA
jgi:O-antigen/teichoic acid export membrane protein